MSALEDLLNSKASPATTATKATVASPQAPSQPPARFAAPKGGTQIGPNTYRTPSGSTWTYAPNGTRQVTLAPRFGGGAYNVNPTNTNQVVNTGHSNYGGLPPKKGFQRNDVIPVSQGGDNSNLKNLLYQPLDQAKAQDQVEQQQAKDIKNGKTTLAQARLQTLTRNQDQQNPPAGLARRFLSSLGDVIQKPLDTVARFATNKVLQPVADTLNNTVGERVGAIGRSIQQKSLAPLGESFQKQYHEMNPNEQGISPKEKIQRLTNIALMANVDAGLNSGEKPSIENPKSDLSNFDQKSPVQNDVIQGSGVNKTQEAPQSTVVRGPRFGQSPLSSVENASFEPNILSRNLDVKPAVEQGKSVLQEIKNALSPQYASKEATETADQVRFAKASQANALALESSKFKDVENHFNKFSDDQNIQNIANYERTGKFTNEPNKGYSEFYKKSTDEAHQILNNVYKDPVGYVDNYVKRQYKFASPADEQAATNYFQEKYSRFATDKSPTKGRTLDIPIDQALTEMRQQGINVKPVTTNPEILRQWTVANAKHAQLFESLRKLALETQDPNVARILNNATSKGLENSPTFRGIRTINNAINQVQLGFSAFHGTGTAINASISDLALGLRKLGTGDLAEGAKTIGKSAVPGLSFARDILKGKEFINDLKAGDPVAAKVLQDKVNPGGARIKTDTSYYNKAWQNMVNSYKQGNIVGGTLRIPGAVIEKVAEPLMSYAIPRVKIASYLDLVADIDRRMPNASDAVKAREYAKAWDSIDNRFGQLTYDNLFWNKTAQQLAQVSTRSVGWNLGTLRELGGGLSDIGTQTLRGKGVSDRTLYTLALPIYVGTIGAVYQYLHTGKAPTSVADFFYPKNGLKTPQGSDDRTSLPSYMKDAYSYATSPLQTVGHKTSPLLSIAYELATNKDYYGDLIRNPDDPVAKQLEQTGGYALQQLQPFTVQSSQKLSKEGAPPMRRVESFLGFNKAPGSVTNTDLKQNQHIPRTPEQVQHSTDIHSIYDKVQSLKNQGKTDEAQNIVDNLSDSDYKSYQKLRSNDRVNNILPVARQVRDLIKQGRQDEAQTIIDDMTDEEYRAYQSAKKKLNP